jgi:hypothetical protein
MTTKRVARYDQLQALRAMLAEEVAQPTDAADIAGAEFRLYASRVVATLDARIIDLFCSMTSEEQHQTICARRGEFRDMKP